MSIRSKVLLSMMLLVFMICAAFLFLLYQQNLRNLDQMIESKRTSASLLADSILSNTRQHYQLRAKSFINYRTSESKLRVIKAFSDRDRDELLRLSRPFFDLLKEENHYFSSLAWILPDNRVLLKVHIPDAPPENISAIRPDIAMVNRDRVQLSGFSTGLSGSMYRVLQPVFWEGNYLGVLQMGIDAREIIDSINEKLHLPAGLRLVDKKLREKMLAGQNGLTCSGHIIHSTDNRFFEELEAEISPHNIDQQVKVGARSMVLHKVLSLDDYKGDHFGCLFVATDISAMKSTMNKSLLTGLMLSGLMLLLTYVLLYFSFGLLIDKILQLNRSLEKSNRELEQRVEARSAELMVEVEGRKEAEDRLQRAEKMEAIGMMASGVAHDLNNILSGIVNYPELLLMRLPQDSKLRRPVQQIKDSGLRAAAVVADLLTVARDIAKIRTSAGLNRLVLDYLNSPEAHLLMNQYPELKIRTELDHELPPLSCSPTHVTKCIMNLVLNAAEAFDGPGEILLTTTRMTISAHASTDTHLAAGDYLVLRVRDNGPGIAEDDLSHIFEPFYTKKKMGRSGTGIGLAVVWNCMQDHGGYVNVRSAPEAGTTFTLLFPVAEIDEDQEPQEEGGEEILGSGQSVLVVDDEPQQRDIAAQLLAELGYRVETCDSGEKAIVRAQADQYDLLLLDMMMEPGINGCETFAEIKKIHPRQKALIISGFSEADLMDSALSLGVRGYLLKPYTVDQLARAVNQVFRG